MTTSGKMFVCGDIHGCYDELMNKLEEIGFNQDSDHLYALGDLVDRGPKNVECLELLNKPWFSSIKGNHEKMMEISFADPILASWHIQNGGAWFHNLARLNQIKLVNLVSRLPLTMTLTTPSGRKIGLVHAEPAGNDWDEFHNSAFKFEEPAIWGRNRIRLAKQDIHQIIENVDMVYMGHTPIKEPLQSGNMRWIDTGCFATGVITVEELI
jgi:serine/threonine protein phosphatase 1